MMRGEPVIRDVHVGSDGLRRVYVPVCVSRRGLPPSVIIHEKWHVHRMHDTVTVLEFSTQSAHQISHL